MARPVYSSDVDHLERTFRKRNIVCSRKLLQALRLNHGVYEIPQPKPEPIPEPVAPFVNGMSKIDHIKRVVCKLFVVSRDGIESNSRKATLVFPRQIAMYLARKHTTNSLPEIGRRFGGRDHSTIWFAFYKMERLRQSDESVAKLLQDIEAELPA